MALEPQAICLGAVCFQTSPQGVVHSTETVDPLLHLLTHSLTRQPRSWHSHPESVLSRC